MVDGDAASEGGLEMLDDSLVIEMEIIFVDGNVVVVIVLDSVVMVVCGGVGADDSTRGGRGSVDHEEGSAIPGIGHVECIPDS